MYGDLKSLNSMKKVIRFSKINIKKKFKIVYCPPYTLLDSFSKKINKTKIELGAQNCHFELYNGPYTGSISPTMIKKIGCKYVIIGHSENRLEGENDNLINKKIKSSTKCNLNIIFCIGENKIQKKKKQTFQVLKNQLVRILSKKNTNNNIIVAYEPIWSIGTGQIPKQAELTKTILFIKRVLRSIFKKNKPIVLYGGSVDESNINLLKQIHEIDGFLIGGASKSPKKFIDIIKNYYR